MKSLHWLALALVVVGANNRGLLATSSSVDRPLTTTTAATRAL